ncbi:MAG TPA: SprT family zinc-dependent metalloprotease [Steroidobacteraceae bacterium]|nr:SprT family zinc-dependent metalloprotease [Steroidobacteraceae bacterium]
MLETATPQLPLWSEPDPQAWVLRESARARRLAVRVFRSGRVEVVVPPRTSRAAVEQFLARHREWIERKRHEAARSRVAEEPFPPRQVAFPAVGELWRVHAAGGTGRLRVAASSGLICLVGASRGAHELRSRLSAWLIEHARQALGGALAQCARELGFSYARVSIRRQRTRWGSCSAQGTISLNCCLMFQTPEVLRYLMIHELAHTRHMNHSRRFWECVAAHCPDYRRLDRELLEGWRRVPAWVFGEVRP